MNEVINLDEEKYEEQILNMSDDFFKDILLISEIEEFNDIKKLFNLSEKNNRKSKFIVEKDYPEIKNKYTRETYFLPRHTTDLESYNRKNKNYKCIECQKKDASNSHSVSNSHLRSMRNRNKNKQDTIYGFRESIISDLDKLLNIPENWSIFGISNKFNLDDYNYYSLGTNHASTFPGFCDSSINGNKCDSECFKDLDGNKIKDFNAGKYDNLSYQIIYRTIAWKTLKVEQEIIVYENLKKLYENEKTFQEIYDLLLINSLEKLNIQSDPKTFEYQIKTLKDNKKYYQKFLNKIKNKTEPNKYIFKCQQIKTPEYIGINYYHKGDSPKNYVFFKELNSLLNSKIDDFFTGILYLDNNYYFFVICNLKDSLYFDKIIGNSVMTEHFMKKCLISVNNTNTFITKDFISEANDMLVFNTSKNWFVTKKENGITTPPGFIKKTTISEAVNLIFQEKVKG